MMTLSELENSPQTSSCLHSLQLETNLCVEIVDSMKLDSRQDRGGRGLGFGSCDLPPQGTPPGQQSPGKQPMAAES